MTIVKAYYLKSTAQIPNSHFPLLHYTGCQTDEHVSAGDFFDLFASNGWEVQWIYRYGQSQASHYHSRSHECMAVLTGTATIRFGAADAPDSLNDESELGEDALELSAKAGDVFIIPAGVAHKTYRALPVSEFKLLTPGSGSGIEASNKREAVASTVLDGFAMIGAYPNGSEWDFVTGGLDRTDWALTWATQKPEKDPVLGDANEGLCGSWHAVEKQ